MANFKTTRDETVDNLVVRFNEIVNNLDVQTETVDTLTAVDLTVTGELNTTGLNSQRYVTAFLAPSQSIPDNVNTQLIFNNIGFGTLGGLNIATGEWTVPVDGNYVIQLRISYPSGAAGFRSASIFHNTFGGETLYNNITADPGSTTDHVNVVFSLIGAQQGGIYQFFTKQNSGGPLNALALFTQVSIFKLA